MTIHEHVPTISDDSTESTDREMHASRRRHVIAIVLIVALSSILNVGVLSGAPPPRHLDSAASNCAPDAGAGNAVAWHVERYGGGCHENEFTRFPEGQRIDHIGDPPWIPL